MSNTLESKLPADLRLAAMDGIMQTPLARQIQADFVREAVVKGSVLTVGNIEAQNLGPAEGSTDRFRWRYNNIVGNSVQIVTTTEEAKKQVAEVAVIKAFVKAFPS